MLSIIVTLPASDVVQERQLSVHQAGQQSDLQADMCTN